MGYDDIKKLMEYMGKSQIDNLSIEFPDGLKINMKKENQVEKQMDDNKKTTVNNAENAVVPQIVETEKEEKFKVIKSPMVGTFYSSSSPNDKPFIKVGDKVTKGQVLCIVEAMKLMNEIESDFDGEIVEICVKNEDVVEYGTPLFKLS